MSVRTGLLVFCAAVFVLVAGSLYVVSRALDTGGDIAQAEVRRYQSYKLADGLRQTSDDLTRMARLYVATGDARYRTYFEQILAIRDGGRHARSTTTGTSTGTSWWRGGSLCDATARPSPSSS